MKPQYKILLVTNMWPYPGDSSYGAFIKEQAESLRALGVEYDLLFINGRESKWNYARGVRELHRKLRHGRYNLVHAHFGLAGCVARLQARAPLVVTFHGDDVLGRPKRSGRITAKGRVFQASSFLLARSVAAVIVQSQEMRQKLRLPRAQVIPCGIDLDLFQPMEQKEARAKLGLRPEMKYALFPYNPAEERKRFDAVEEAVRLARREVPNLEILLVKGRPHSEMPLFMNAADLLVMASMIEGSPVAAKEAMAVNLPIISVRVGDMAELIEKTEGCYLIGREPSAIAGKIIEVCQRGERTRGREVVASKAMDKIAHRILEVYSRVAR